MITKNSVNLALLCALIIVAIGGCSTIAGGTAVFIVSSYSDKKERTTRRYKRIDKCFLAERPEAFLIAESIAHGTPISSDYNILLNPEMEKKDPPQPHHVAYSFYAVADRIGDSRGEAGKQWIASYMKEGEAEDIDDFISRKYLASYLSKCFSVPRSYKTNFSRGEVGALSSR